MITGIVRFGEASIRLVVVGLRGREREIDAIIDTGYTASLTLPPSVVHALGLRWEGIETFTMAEGSPCMFDVYVAKVRWDGKLRKIYVNESDADPLVGMRLSKGHELTVDVRARGKVTIKRLARG